MYDLRKSCDRSPDKDGPLCYKEAEWIPVWLNDKGVKKELGAHPGITFVAISPEVSKDFLASGDLMYYSAGLLTDLVNDGIRLLVYAGDTGRPLSSKFFYSRSQVPIDAACNALGQSRWVEKFSSFFHDEYAQAPTLSWRVNGQVAGTVRTAGGDGTTAGNITLVTIHEAGHMVPHDKPEEALVRLH